MMRKGIAGWSARASFMKSRNTGAAVEPPVSFGPRVRGWSKPMKTPATRSGEKPMNQLSKLSLEVPVLPASGLPTAFTFVPVPRSTTPSSMWTTW